MDIFPEGYRINQHKESHDMVPQEVIYNDKLIINYKCN